MNERLRGAYYEYLDDLAHRGIVDHALNIAVIEGKSIEAHIVDVLRAADRLPKGWDRDGSQAIVAGQEVIDDGSPIVRLMSGWAAEESRIIARQRSRIEHLADVPELIRSWPRAS